LNRLLINPSAGRGKSRRALGALRRLAEQADCDLAVSTSALNLVDHARTAAEDGVERFLVAGGDGTFHHVAQGLAGSTCALGVIPLGRGNDFASDLSVPCDFEEAFRYALTGPIRSIDLGRVGERYFTGYCGVGFDSEAAHYAQEAPALFRGPLAYVYSVLRTMFTFLPPLLSAGYEGGDFTGKAMFAVACNISRFGGGMRIAPEARFDDGALDLVIAKELGKIQLLRVFPKVYSGKHVNHPAVQIHRTRTATISVDRALAIACDGELVGHMDDRVLQVSVEPDSLRVVAPQTP
jgi:diacylglycerol kinase (ATP)